MIKMTTNGGSTILASIGRLQSKLGEVENTLVRDSAEQLAAQLKRNITEQTFGDFGKPHNRQWAYKKRKEGNNPGKYWLYKGKLLNAIRSRKLRKEQYEVFIAGNSSSKNNPAEYGPEIERKRPLFARTFAMFKKDWNKNCGETINKLKQCWY